MPILTVPDRLRRLAAALKLTPTPRLDVVKAGLSHPRWVLVGCIEGDQPLPQTSGCRTLPEALDAAEAWLAPELDKESKP